MGPDAEEGLAHDDKRRDVEDEVGGQIMKIQPIVPRTNGWMGNPSPLTKWVRKTTLSWGSGIGTICPALGSRCAIFAARYPDSHNSLMFSSMTEETIHLLPALDMLGVI